MSRQRKENENVFSGIYPAAKDLLVVLSLLLCLPAICQAQKAEEQIETSIALMEKKLSSVAFPDDGAKQRHTVLLNDAKSALKSGRLYLSLNKLSSSWIEITAAEYVQSKADVEKGGVDAFEKEWKRLGQELDERERLILLPRSRRVPAAAQALAESGLFQMHPYYQSGRLYGLNTTLNNGLFYFGLVPAFLGFSQFCLDLPLEQNRQPLQLRSIESELNRLETETLEAFRRSDQDKQLLFILLNSTLKLASELNRDGKYAGALYKYLDANIFLGRAVTPSPRAEELPRLKAQCSLFEKRLKTADVDHSIGMIYWESAQSLLDQANPDNLNPEEMKRVVVILDRVLPAYFKFCGDKS
jgi:hypothetical protein